MGHTPESWADPVFVDHVVGGIVGFAVGRVGAELLRRVALPASGLYPLVVFAFAVLAYGSAAA